MKTIIVVILSFSAGIFLTWFYLHGPEDKNSYDSYVFTELLTKSNTNISQQSLHCEVQNSSIGSILAEKGFFTLNSDRISNTRFYCEAERCSLFVSSCRPWQSSDCGQTFINFRLDSYRKIIDSSIECIDVP